MDRGRLLLVEEEVSGECNQFFEVTIVKSLVGRVEGHWLVDW